MTGVESLSADELVSMFTRIGLDISKAQETLKNGKLTNSLREIVVSAGYEYGCEKSKGMLLYTLATKLPSNLTNYRDTLIMYISKDKIRGVNQLDAAFDFLKKHAEFSTHELEDACGIDIHVTEKDIHERILLIIHNHTKELLQERYLFNFGVLLKEIKEVPRMKWADGKVVKEEMDKQILTLLGPKTEADEQIAQDRKKKGNVEKSSTPVATSGLINCNEEDSLSAQKFLSEKRSFEGEVLKFHKPEENRQLYPWILQRHLEATGGKVMTRFPPEPNGFLHIGHAKAINFNFKYAELMNGHCYLRYDDTNPEAEEERFFVSIHEIVEWLGFTPWKITHSSDYFEKLYLMAEELIRRDKAYVCFQTPEEMYIGRGGDEKGPRTESPWRNRPVEESLQLFRDMRDGKFADGIAILRMKMNMQSGNPYMWDPVAYRILRTPHPQSGTDWVIYPTYDFTHCLCDSMENITHSLCTTEFTLAREAYYWLCDALEVYRPVQWEYSRLNITNTVLSKRKLTKLVEGGYVDGWDDPRLFTLVAVRRRGFTPRAINQFVELLGITTSKSIVDLRLLESCVREDLNSFAPRAMAVLHPLRVIITNYPNEQVELLTVPNVLHDPSCGTHVIPFGRVLYIDRDDFREHSDDPHYYRLSVGKTVGLHHAYNIHCDHVVKDDQNMITEIHVTYDPLNHHKVKSHLQWVAHSPAHHSPIHAQLCLYSHLFLSKDPMSASGGWLTDINPHSLQVIDHAFLDCTVANARVEDKYQFERVGYFCMDKTSTPEYPVFNLTVSLKEDPKKVK